MTTERPITSIIIHCTYSEWGDVKAITKWHTDPPPAGRGWTDCGYHRLVYNQFTSFDQINQQQSFCSSTDGLVVPARPLSQIGSHAKNHNSYSIGLAYVGVSPTAAQYNSLLYVCRDFMRKYPLIKLSDIKGHYECTDSGKTCPNFDMKNFRNVLSMYL